KKKPGARPGFSIRRNVRYSELHADAEGDAVVGRVDAARAATGREVGAAVVRIAVLDAAEHVVGELDVGARASSPAEHAVAVAHAAFRHLHALSGAASSAVKQNVRADGIAETRAKRALETVLDFGSGIAAVRAVVPEL